MSMRFILAILLTVLAGCGGEPDESTVKRDVAARLSRALPPDTVALHALVRKGSQAVPNAPDGAELRTVYFGAELSVTRDFDFGAWDSPGIAGLISALGAGPKGLSGLTPGGNKAGDTLHIQGTAVYRHDGKEWTPVVPAGYEPPAAPAYAITMPQHGTAAAFEAMRKVIEAVPKDAAPAQRLIIEEEITAAMAVIRSRLARASDGYAIAAGPEQGQYLRLAQALVDAGGPKIVPLVTRGGDDNLRLLRDGKVALALSQADAALDAYLGRGNFAAEGPYVGLRAIGSLYPEPVHVVVRSSSSIRSVSQLKGQRVAIGQQGAAARATAIGVLAAHGLQVDTIKPSDVAFGEALTLLQRGELDAVIHVIGTPADSVRAALALGPLRLVPLSPQAIGKLVAGSTSYREYVIPPGAYATQLEPVPTVATAAVLLAGPMLSEVEVASLTKFIFAHSIDLVVRGSAQGAQISAATARLALPLPFHPGAEKALGELGTHVKR